MSSGAPDRTSQIDRGWTGSGPAQPLASVIRSKGIGPFLQTWRSIAANIGDRGPQGPVRLNPKPFRILAGHGQGVSSACAQLTICAKEQFPVGAPDAWEVATLSSGALATFTDRLTANICHCLGLGAGGAR